MHGIQAWWAAFAVSSAAVAQTYEVPPIDGQAVTEDGIAWTLDTGGETLNTARFSIGIERRAVLEFPIEVIPEGVLVASATITFEVAGLTYSGDEFPVIQFHGYAGDGVLSVDDAQRPANLIGQSGELMTLGEKPVVALDAAYIQGLFGKTTHLGIYTYQGVLNRQVDFWSTEAADIIPVEAATLSLELQVPVQHGDLIYVPDRRDLVWDPHRRLLYITTDGGRVERFDAESRLLLPPWTIGDSLLGADIAPDGASLFVAGDLDPDEMPRMHKVDLDTGMVSTFMFEPGFSEGRAWDIKIVSNERGFVTTDYQGSGWVPFREFDVTTGAAMIREDIPGSSAPEVRGTTILRRSADRSTVYVLEGNISSGPAIVYDTATDSFVSHVDTGSGWNELAAASPGGEMVARMIFNSIDVRDRSLDPVTELETVRGGVVFDPKRPMLYVADEDANRVVGFDTRTFEMRFDMPVGEQVYVSEGFDEGMMEVSHDGSLLFLATHRGVRLYELTGLDAGGVAAFADCLFGPGAPPSPSLPGLLPADCIRRFDCDADGDVDLADSAQLAVIFGPGTG